MSTLFLRTLRDDPADAEVASHRLLVRAGYIRRQAPGIFAWLPIGLRVKRRVEQVIREELAAAGAQVLQALLQQLLEPLGGAPAQRLRDRCDAGRPTGRRAETSRPAGRSHSGAQR